MHNPIVEQGINAIYKELSPVKTIEFFQKLGINRGDSVKEIESITEKLTREEVLERVRKVKK